MEFIYEDPEFQGKVDTNELDVTLPSDNTYSSPVIFQVSVILIVLMFLVQCIWGL